MSGPTKKKISELELPWPDPVREIGAPEVTKGIFGELFKGKNKRKKHGVRETHDGPGSASTPAKPSTAVGTAASDSAE